MITSAKLVSQPLSGEFEERVFDNSNAWNSQSWTWVKFVNENGEWCGQFRGMPRKIAISKKLGKGIVLTSDYLFEINLVSENVRILEDQPQYQNLTVAPDGSFIISDYYTIERFEEDFSLIEIIESPIRMDMIEFKDWENDVLTFTCDEFLNWDRHLEMRYDNEFNRISIKR